jgi:hypothetical protein
MVKNFAHSANEVTAGMSQCMTQSVQGDVQNVAKNCAFMGVRMSSRTKVFVGYAIGSVVLGMIPTILTRTSAAGNVRSNFAGIGEFIRLTMFEAGGPFVRNATIRSAIRRKEKFVDLLNIRRVIPFASDVVCIDALD